MLIFGQHRKNKVEDGMEHGRSVRVEQMLGINSGSLLEFTPALGVIISYIDYHKLTIISTLFTSLIIAHRSLYQPLTF